MNQQERNGASSDGRAPTGGFAAMVPELDVTSLPASLDFWCRLLGFEIAYARREAGFAYLERGPLQIMLCEINNEWDTAPLERPFGRGINFQMQVDRVEPIVQALTDARWPLFRPIEEKRYRVGAGWSSCKEFLVQDPDGYLLRFAADGASVSGGGSAI
ncbi:VOC family protein [Achromobacter sp. Bel]|uniref:bleomycin resistance protein n=1 Tax=Achromobacter sp. Bel TaxID=2727415 RepID=UPI00145FB57F|nr:VOC family protein [Achromobacter sp. Bel]NMK48909.1 VOC family protein [Achromobacter sp. Bel]